MTAVGATVRGAASRDLDSLLPLVEAFQEFERIPFESESARRNLGQLLENPRLGQVLIAELAGRPIGYAILTWGYDLEFGGMDAYLTDLFLAEPERGRGLGQWLLDEVERAARDAGVQALHLMVAPQNHRAHHIYHRSGFHVSPRLFLTKVLGIHQP